MPKFPEISDERRKEMLAPQPGRVRVVIDTDAANEVDDQFAITWGLLSPDRLDIEAIIAAPFSRAYFREPLLAAARAKVDESTAASVDNIAAWVHRLRAAGIDPGDLPFETTREGMEMSYAEIDTIMSKLGMSSEGVAFRGAERFMEAPDDIVDSEGARRIIEAAMADDDRLRSCRSDRRSYQHRRSSTDGTGDRYPDGGVLDIRLPDVRKVQQRTLDEPGAGPARLPPAVRLRRTTPIPAGLLHRRAALDVAAGIGTVGQGARRDRLLPTPPLHPQPSQGSAACRTLPGPVPGVLGFHQLRMADRSDLGADHVHLPTPTLDNDLVWQHLPDRPLMSEATDVDRDAVYRDFFRKLDQHSKTARQDLRLKASSSSTGRIRGSG